MAETGFSKELRAFMDETGESAYAISVACGLDGGAAFRVLKGGRPTRRTWEEIRIYMAKRRAEIAERIRLAEEAGRKQAAQ